MPLARTRAVVAATAGLEDAKVLADEPAELAGLPAFRLHLADRVQVYGAGLRCDQIVPGVAHPRGLYLVGYRPSKLHHFERDRAAFEESARTLATAADAKHRSPP